MTQFVSFFIRGFVTSGPNTEVLILTELEAFSYLGFKSPADCL